MTSPITLAAIQLNASADRARNFEQAANLVRAAAASGAGFVALPENTDQIAPREQRLAQAETLEGQLVSAYRELARQLEIWLLLGSFGEKASPGHVHNTSVLIRPNGELAAVYRKIHLFDANPPDGVPYRESDAVEPGREVVTFEAPFATIGLSICYDLRFPELYRQHASRGASLLTVPSAFTVPTGRAHWEPLLRARAIENLSYVLAPAQVGEHGPNRRSYGHAMIIDPWGTVLAEAGGDQPGFVTARFDPAEVERVRTMISALNHRRL